MEDLLRVGVIANTHGVHGEVKVFPTTDDVNRFKKLKTVKALSLANGMFYSVISKMHIKKIQK